MKFYVTGRSNNYSRVEEAFALIKHAGHTVTFEWTTLPMAKPYAENAALAAKYAVDGIQGVIDADVYIVFTSKEGNGVYTEFGAALAAHAITGKPRIFAIGADQDSAMFNYHPAVEWRGSVEEVIKELQ